jgi:lipoprotein-releasing system permease protein
VKLLLLSALAPASRHTRLTAQSTTLLERIWDGMVLWQRIALSGVAVLLLIAIGWLFLRMALRGRFRALLLWFTLANLALVAGLGAWAVNLPDPKGTYFVLWHQIVRVGAVLSGAGFLVGFMALAVPVVLDRFEGRSFVPFIAARHVRSSKSGFLTIISVLSVLGVAVSSLALCVVVSIMGGFGADLKRKILGNNAHVKIEASRVGGFAYYRDLLEEARLVRGVRGVTPIAGGEAMASSASNTSGVLVRGIDPTTIGSVIDLLGNVEVGDVKYLTDTKRLANLPPEEPIGLGVGGEVYLKGPSLKLTVPDLDADVEDAVVPNDVYPGVILGRELAKTLHVYVGDEITLVSPLGDLGPMGILPRSRRFRVAAVFYSGMYEYDQSHAYMTLETAQEFLDMPGKVTGIEIRVEDAERIAEVRPGIENLIKDRPDLQVRDWMELNRNLFSALKLEKIATFVILSIAILVASFCIICTLLLMVTEKSKEIAILKALGASDRAILRIFLWEGVMIGGMGTLFGVATGLALTLGLSWFGVRLDPEVYYIDRLPISLDPVDFLFVALSALAITTLATLYPASAASRLRPVDGIRYE